MPKKDQKWSKKLLKKQIEPYKKSSPKISFVDCEAHQSEISCYLAK